MNKYLFFFLLYVAATFSFQVRADDASAVSYEHWSYGHIKADSPNKQIALEKELMEVFLDSIRAIFIFRNTSNQQVETPCVFPINSSLSMFPTETRGDSVYFQNIQGSANLLLWAIALDEKIEHNCFAKSSLAAANKRLRKYTYADYLNRVMLLTNTSYLSGCSITQNGQHVPIENVGIETTFNGKGLDLDAYFYHFLKFKPYEVSKVVVSYPVETFESEYDGCRRYGLKYDISSGGTWKGSIKSFMVYSTMFMESKSSNPLNANMKGCSFSDQNVYFMSNYKPEADDYFVFGSGVADGECYTFFEEKNEATKNARIKDYLDNDSCIRIVNARDELNPIAYFPKRMKRLPFVVNVTSSTNSDASALFDGNLYTPYVAPATSYVEFSLTRPVIGPFVSNGFVGNLFNEKVFYAVQADLKRAIEDPERREGINEDEFVFPVFQDSLWKNISRAKTVLLKQIGTSESFAFSLADKYGVLPTEREGWQGVNAVQQPKILLPGRYRLTFSEVYKGDKSNDVALSEIWFYPYPDELLAIVEDEKGDSLQLFQESLKKIAPNWVTEYSFVPYELLRSQYSDFYKKCQDKYSDDNYKLCVDSLCNYYVECIEKVEETDASQANNDEQHNVGSIEAAGKLYRYMLIGGCLLLLVVGGFLLYKRRKK